MCVCVIGVCVCVCVRAHTRMFGGGGEGGREDFNVIRRFSKKMGDCRVTPNMRDFDIFIRECKLSHPLYRMLCFTWSNMQDSPICKRLDRFLYSNEWEQNFPQSLQEVLPRWTSDHCPIALDTNPFKWGPTLISLGIIY